MLDRTLSIPLPDGIELRALSVAEAPALSGCLNANRDHLDRWLRWSSSVVTTDDAEALISEFIRKEQARDGFHAGVWVRGELAGGIVVWYVHAQNRNAEMGYWLARRFVGQGIATRAARAVLGHLFEERALHRVELLCGAENRPSRAIAERLGFTLEGVRRESHWITSRFVDHAVYGLLAREWRSRREAVP